MKRLFLILTAATILVLGNLSQAAERHEIAFPDLPGYKTLKCDLHMHTVFSDGYVWPTVRVDEAWRTGLDAIAISDHIEYQPFKGDVPTKHNRPYELAADRARQMDLLLIKATEITRSTPPGHFNAIFISDANPLDTESFVEAVKQANDQEAFVFWNHQALYGEENGRWQDVHTKLYDNKWLHGMEVCGGKRYYPSAHKWCLEKNLTMMGNSDIHRPDLRKKSSPEDHRTITLVFAKEKTGPALKEALREGRTAVWFKLQIIGRKELLGPLFDQCVMIEKPHLSEKEKVWVKVKNISDLDISLKRTGELGPPLLELPARSTSNLRISTETPDKPLELHYSATNFLIAPGESLDVVLLIPGKKTVAVK